MAKVFIGGSRKWDMFPDEVIVDLDNRILYDIVNDACDHNDEIYIGDCPQGIDKMVFNCVIGHNKVSPKPVKLVIVCNDEPRFTWTWWDVHISVISLKELYEKGELSEFFENRDILIPDWEDQRLKDEWMLENTNIHRFIWNGKSRATYRNAQISGYTTECDNTIIYRPYVVADRIVWTAKFTYFDDNLHDDGLIDI